MHNLYVLLACCSLGQQSPFFQVVASSLAWYTLHIGYMVLSCILLLLLVPLPSWVQSQSFRVPQWLLLLHDTPLWALPLYKSVFANIIGKTFPAVPLDPGGYPAPPDVRPFPTPQRTSDGFPTRCVCSILAFLPFDDTAIVTSFYMFISCKRVFTLLSSLRIDRHVTCNMSCMSSLMCITGHVVQ